MTYRLLLENILDVFSLSDNAKNIFITSYQSGDQTVGQLVERLGMDRSSAYLAIDQLKTLGLIEIDESRRPKLVHAVEPRKLLGRIETKIQDLEQVFDKTHDSLPELMAAYKSQSRRPTLQAYNGNDGLRQIMEDILSSKDEEVLLFTNQAAERESFSDHNHDYFIRKRKQNNLSIRVIATDDQYAKKLAADDAQNLRRTRIYSGKPPFECETYIYGESVAMLSFSDEIIGFIVNSADFSKLQRWQFEKIWEQL
ncbi:MAG TPA: helix-turn-helix domain-containing protein [Candidatus Binatia bacterium]|nr:helix-turn-helix domain-containing protein [Candidatus Binatia bacterium]